MRRFYKFLMPMLLMVALAVPIGSRAQSTLTVANGTTTNSYVPIYGYYMDEYNRSQIIYPASMLADMTGGTISGLKFYSSSTSALSWSSSMSVKMMEVPSTTFSGTSFISSTAAPVLWTGTLSVANGEMTVTLTTPYEYGGGNLLIEFYSNTDGNYLTNSFYGISSTGSSLMGYHNDGLSSISPSQRNFLPKVTFTYTPDPNFCYPPQNLAATADDQSITVTWVDTNNSGATYEALLVDAAGDTLEDYTNSNVSSPYTFTGLTANTAYTVLLRSNCSTGNPNSPYVSFSQRTACAAMASLPFNEGFEGYATGAGNRPSCWGVLNAYGNYPYISSTHHSGANSYYLYTNNSDTIMVATPMLNGSLNALHIMFWAYCSNYGRLQVGVMSDTSDLSTFQPMFYLNGNGSNWREYEIYTDTATATGNGFVVFRYTGTSSTSYSCYIDDIAITEASSCRRPTEAWVDSLNHYSASLGWENLLAPAGYEVRYDTVNDVESASGQSVTIAGTDTTVTLTGLQGHTTYYAWIRATCGGESSDWRAFPSFTTDYRCYAVTDLSASDANHTSMRLSWSYDAQGLGEAPDGVEITYRDITDSTIAPVTFEATGTMTLLTGLAMGHSYDIKVRTACGEDTSVVVSLAAATQGCASLTGNETSSYAPFYGLYNYGYTQTIYPASAVSAIDTITGVSFRNTSTSTSVPTRTVDVYVGFTNQTTLSTSNYIAASNLTLVASNVSLDVSTTGWKAIPFSSPVVVNHSQNIVIAVVNKTGSWDGFSWSGHTASVGNVVYWYHDTGLILPTNPSASNSGTTTVVPDIEFMGHCEASCEAPVAMVSETSESSVDLSWSYGDENSWLVRYKVSGTDEWTVIENLSTSSYSVSGLAAATYYQFAVGVVCDEDTLWGNDVVGHTECATAVTLPYYTSFEGQPTSQMPLCWTRSTTGNAYVSSNYANQGTRSLYLYSASGQSVFVATPMLDGDANALEVIFKGRFSNSMASIQAGLMTDPSDTSTFEPLWTLSQGNANTYTEYLFYTTASTVTVPACLAFRYTGNGNASYIDSLVINAFSGCQKPIDVAVSGTTHESAVIKWTGSMEYNYGIHVDTTATFSDDATDNYTAYADTTYTITGLQPMTRYYAWVRTLCSDMESDWIASPVTFRTTMEGVPLPYSTGFEGDSLDWVIENGDAVNAWAHGSAVNNGGSKSLYISQDNGTSNTYSVTSTSNVLAYKTFTIADTGLYAVSFDWKANGEGCCDYLRVLLAPGSVELVGGSANGISTTGAPTGWIAADGGSKLNAQTSWQNSFATFHVTEPGNYNLVLFWHNDYSAGTNPPAAVDNLQFTNLRCPQPTNLDTSNLTTNSVNLRWHAGGSETSWLVRVNGGDWMIASDTTYPLTGLNSSTSYLVEVVADCGEGDTSFSTTIGFRTKDLCTPISGLRLTSVSYDSASFAWTNATVNEWGYEYGPAGFAEGTGVSGVIDTNKITIQSLVAGTTYEFRIWSSCTAGNSDTASLLFSTRGLPVELPYSTGFESTDDNAWDLVNGTATNKWFIGSAVNNGGSRSLYVSNNNGVSNEYSHSLSRVYAYREIHIGSAGDYAFSYDWKAKGESSSYDYLRVYLAPASVNISAGSTPSSSWISLATAQNQVDEWQHYVAEHTFNTADTGIYKLVFYWYNDGSGGSQPPAAVDNVVVREITCPNIRNLAATGITSNSANLKWDARQATAWVVEYDTAGFTRGTGTMVAVTDSVYTITGLTAGTTYIAYVAAVCPGNDTGAFSYVTFRTIAPAASVPYSTSFEAGQDADWAFLNGTNGWMVGTATHSTLDTAGTHALYVSNTGSTNAYNTSTTSMNYAYRQLNITTPGEYFCTFDWKAYGEGGYDYLRAWLVPVDSFNVVVNRLPDGTTAPYSYQTSTPAGWIDLGGKMNLQSTWQSVVKNFNIANSGLYNLVFMWANDGSSGTQPPAAVDNIWIGIPTCTWPMALGVDSASLADSSIYFSWQPGGSETAWEVQYGSSYDTVTTPQYTLSHLTGTAATLRTIRVRALCSDEDHSFWREVSGHLPCAPDTVPFLNDFDNLSGAFTNNCWGVGNSAGQAQNGYQNWPYCIAFTGTTSDKLLFLNNGAYVILPDLNVPLNQLYLTFDFSSSHDSSALYLGYASCAQAAYEKVVFFDTLYHGDYATPEEFRGRVEMLLNNLPAEAHNLVIASPVVGTGHWVGLNELNLTLPPTCGHVENVVATPVNETSVTLSWSPSVFGTAQNYIVEYGVRPYAPGSSNGHVATSATTSVTLTGLDPMTPYQAYITTDCGQGDSSVATMPIEFAGLCGTISVPDTFTFSEYLMSGRSMTNTLPNCWVLDSSSVIYSEDSILAQVYGANSNASMVFLMYDQCVVALPATNKPLDSLMLTFNMSIGDSRIALVIGAVSSLADGFGSTFEAIDTLRYADNGLVTSYLAPYAGTNTHIAFKNIALDTTVDAAEVVIDNLVIAVGPSCLPIRHLEVSATTVSSVTLDWDDVVSAGSWAVEYGRRGFTRGTGTVQTFTSHPATIAGLTTATAYDFYVTPVCSATDHGDTVMISATTACGLIGLPYVETFDDVAGVSYSAAGGSLPPCWEGYSNGTSSNYFPHVTNSSSSYHYAQPSSSNSLTLTSGSESYGDTKIVALPQFNVALAGTAVSFWYKMESTSSGTLSIGYVTGSDLSATYVPVEVIPSVSTITRYTVNLTNVPATATRIAFRWEHNASYYSVGIDSVVVTSGSAPISCDVPEVSLAAATNSSITVNFNGTSENYEVAIVEGEWTGNETGTVVSDTTHTFSNLEESTQYTVGVRAVCGGNLYSEWATLEVTTNEHPCAVPTGLAASNVTLNSATLGWTNGEEGQSAWQIHITGEGYDQTHDVTTNPFMVTGLAYGVTYTFTVRAVCTQTNISAWSAPAHFTTIACEGVTNVTVDSVTANSVVISWTAPTGATRFVVNYGSQGFDQGTGSFDTVENATSCTLSGLSANTPYDVYVRTLCEGGTASAWSSVVNFTTSRGNGIDDVNAAKVRLYPNPASTTVTLKGIEGVATVTVVDMNGRKAGEWTVNDGSLTIDVSEMVQGAYFVRIVGEQVNAIRKLIVR